MGLEVYYPADVRNALLAAEQSVSATAQVAGSQDDPFAAGFLTGYRAALTTIALAFGLIRPGGQHGDCEWTPSFLCISRGRD